MSQDLQNTIDSLNKQLAETNQGVQGLLAQLDAHKGMLSESIANNLQLRTNLVLFQKQNKDLNDNGLALRKQIEGLDQQLSDASKRIAELELPIDGA